MKKYYVDVDSKGTVFWYVNAERTILHREDGPAIEYANGTKAWFIDNERRRDDGPAIEWASGSKEWYTDGKLHREDGPAIERANGTRMWCINGKLHREDGPAIVRADGSKSWFINGARVPERRFLEQTQPVEEMTVAQIEQLLGKRIKVVK